MCALKCYVKSLYRHLFFEDISKNARVTKKKRHFLICGKVTPRRLDRRAPNSVCGLLKLLAVIVWIDFFSSGKPPPPPPPPPSYSVEKRRDHRNCVGGRQISVIPPLLNTITQGGGGVHRKKRGQKSIHTITTKGFSYPHTEFGARRSRRLGLATN